MSTCTIITHHPHCERQGHWDTGWRTLPLILLERPLGGGWDIHFDSLPAIHIASGEMAVVPAGWRHRLVKSDRDGAMTSSWCYLRWTDDAGLPWPIPTQPTRIAGPAATLIDDLGAGGATIPEQARRQRAAWQILEVLTAGQESPEAPSDPRIPRLLAWIQAHLHESLDRAILAAEVGCSPTRLHDLCVQATGLAPMSLLARQRVARAQELLLGSSLPLGEIAERCGYSSPFWFSRAFRAACGQTPSAYRAAHAGG